MKPRIAAWLNDTRLADETLHAVAERVRSMILAQGKVVAEEIKYSGLLFGAPQAFCGVFVYRGHVSLELGAGAALSDPHHVLEGSGKCRCHIKLRSLMDIENKYVSVMLQQAWRHNQAA